MRFKTCARIETSKAEIGSSATTNSGRSIDTSGIILLSSIGFIPTIVAFPITKKIGGEPIGEIILRYMKFKKSRKMYIYTKEEK